MRFISDQLRFVANSAWIAGYRAEHARFSASLNRVHLTQESYLKALLSENAQTRFGVAHQFSKLRTIRDYQNAVPIRQYEGFGAELDAVSRGETGVLCKEAVTRFLPTSGSTSPSKLIPWTASLSAEFQRGIAPWLYELYHQEPGLLRGSAYWSISPATTAQRSAGVLPVGFENDSAYLGFWARLLFGLVSAVPAGIARIDAVERFKDHTLAALLADEQLALISVWSPTFLSGLIEHFQLRQLEVLSLILCSKKRRTRARARWIRELLQSACAPADWLSQIWPRLRVISCWNSGPSALSALRLGELFPGVHIQGKGLVATEAFASLPFGNLPDPILAVRSHFFEFQNIHSGLISLADELSCGESYRLIVTTGGGLYRYTLGDLVQVTAYHKEAPCLRFLGREGNCSDQCGEKLNGRFVQDVVEQGLRDTQTKALFFLLAPVRIGRELRYVLFIELATAAVPEELAAVVEKGLRRNFHYEHCRKLGQLQAVRLRLLRPSSGSAAALYTERLRQRGMKLGDIKLAPLDKELGWETVFSGDDLE